MASMCSRVSASTGSMRGVCVGAPAPAAAFRCCEERFSSSTRPCTTVDCCERYARPADRTMSGITLKCNGVEQCHVEWVRVRVRAQRVVSARTGMYYVNQEMKVRRHVPLQKEAIVLKKRAVYWRSAEFGECSASTIASCNTNNQHEYP